jgi:Brp/Blh family beta-carotene 15,15'-monooxygenase
MDAASPHSLLHAGAGARRRGFLSERVGLVCYLLGVPGVFLLGAAAGEPGAWVWIAGLAIVGMPHGAYDLAAIRRERGGWLATWRDLLVYTLAVGGCFALYRLAPTGMLLAFLALAVHHFGTSDSVWTRGHRRHAMVSRLGAWGWGLVVLASPFVWHPEAAWAPFAALSTWAGGDPAWVGAQARPLAAVGLGAGVLGVTVGLVRLARARRWLGIWESAGVLGIAALLGAIAPPLYAVGAYFLAIHALGHCLRAARDETETERGFAGGLLRVHLLSVPLLIPAVVATLLWSADLESGSPAFRVAAAFIGFCVISTLPHHVLWIRTRRTLTP